MGGTANHGPLRVEFSEMKAAEIGISNLMTLEPNHMGRHCCLLLSCGGGNLLSGLQVDGYLLDL